MAGEVASISCTAFLGARRVASGSVEQVVSVVKEGLAESEVAQLLIFDDSTGEQIEVDFRGTVDDVLKRRAQRPGHVSAVEVGIPASRPVGRPKLGVVSGEVTLLPRHWEWLKSQPGGASVTLRKLIDEARRAGEERSKIRKSQEATYRFMTAMAGNFHQYEEALRALYAADASRFYDLIAEWAPDIRDYIEKLAARAFPQGLDGETNQ